MDDGQGLFEKYLSKQIQFQRSLTHLEFIKGVNSKELAFYVTIKHKYQLLPRTKKYIFYFFLIGYMILPFIIIPALAWRFVNVSLVFGLISWFIGVFSASSRKYAIPGILLPFAIGYWIKQGFDFHQYFTFHFFCVWSGALLYAFADSAEDEYLKQEILSNDKLFYFLIDRNYIVIIQK